MNILITGGCGYIGSVLIPSLLKKGHKIIYDLGSYGGYQAIMIDYINKVYFGASESRKDGNAIGY